MRYIRKSRLERIAEKVLLLPFLFSAGCGTIYRSYGEMVQRGNNIVAPADFDLEGRLTRANKALIRFPNEEQINQEVGTDIVKSVDKYLIPGAKRLLIHARQAHFAKDLSPEKLKTVRNVQTELYLSSEYLTKDKDVRLRRAHDEGITSEGWAQIFIRFFRIIDDINKYHADKLREDIRDIEYKLELNPEDRLAELLEEKRKRLWKVQEDNKRMVTYGAILKLGAEGKLKVLPAEKERLRKYERDLSLKDEIYTKTDLREDTFLEIAANQRGYRVYVVLGGAHAFGGKDSCGKDYDLSGRLSSKDNTAEWNRENPRNKISIIEITFMSYKYDEKDFENVKKAIGHED